MRIFTRLLTGSTIRSAMRPIRPVSAAVLVSLIANAAALATPNLYLFREPGKEVLGEDHGKGNVIGVSPAFRAEDYATPAAFAAKVDGYLAQLSKEQVNGKPWMQSGKTVVAFPELIGLWLMAVNENVGLARKIGPLMQADVAMLLIALHNRVEIKGLASKNALFMAAELAARAKKGEDLMTIVNDGVADGIIRAKAADMAKAYDQAFSMAAKKYGVTILAGSIALPEPSVGQGPNGGTVLKFDPTPGRPIRNVAVAYGPNGNIINITKKVFIPGGEGYTKGAPLEQVRPFDTQSDVGTVGTLICADSWFSQTWAQLKDTPFVLVPQYAAKAGSMAKPWHGYSMTKYKDRLTPDQAEQEAGLDAEKKAKYVSDSKGGIKELDAIIQYTGPYWGPRNNIPYTLLVPNRTEYMDRQSDTGFIATAPYLTKPFVRQAPPQDLATFINVYIQ